MKRLIATILVLHILTLSFGQNAGIKSLVDSLQYLKADTLDCKADLYWRIIAKGKNAIPSLIDKLSDTTQTNVSYRCKGIKLNVGEVAYFALREIAFFPTFDITRIQFDYFDENDCWSFFPYLFNNENKKEYQRMVNRWYNQNKTKLKKIVKSNQTQCHKQFRISTYFTVQD
jgi:hypothetical protein